MWLVMLLCLKEAVGKFIPWGKNAGEYGIGKKAETGANSGRMKLEYHGIYIFIHVYIHICSAEQQLKKHMILMLNKQEQAIWSRG